MTEHEAKVEANEQLAYEYLKEITPKNWTVTRSTNKYERFDVTVSNGNYSFIAENKIRNFNYENNPYGEYALVDVSKIENLKKMDENARVISFFPANNAIFSHKVKDSYKWEKRWVECKKNSFSKEKVWKYEYFLPTTDEYRVDYDIDISDGLTRLEELKDKLCK